MRSSYAVALVGAALVAPASAADGDPLAQLRYLEGSCWRAEFPGGQQADYQCVEPMVEGHFLRSKHVVVGTSPDYWGETVYYWDGETKGIRFIYFTSIGATSRGSVRFDEAGTGFVEERYVLENGHFIELSAELSRPAEDRYDALVRTREGAGLGEETAMEFHRLGGECRTLEDVRAGCHLQAGGPEQ
ncbi:MAG: hypothetical protein R3E14_11205 [Erythrobacter sp.]